MIRLIISIFILNLSFAGSEASSTSKTESVDGKYIMDHIQDQKTFEIINPLDYNDSNYGITTESECKQVFYNYKKKYPNKNIKHISSLQSCKYMMFSLQYLYISAISLSSISV